VNVTVNRCLGIMANRKQCLRVGGVVPANGLMLTGLANFQVVGVDFARKESDFSTLTVHEVCTNRTFSIHWG
jgi:hypothetical protein